jgi:hypothetical protein
MAAGGGALAAGTRAARQAEPELSGDGRRHPLGAPDGVVLARLAGRLRPFAICLDALRPLSPRGRVVASASRSPLLIELE